MAREITIVTPESVELTFELAGIGSRFVAMLVDTLLQLLATLVVVVPLIIFAPGGMPGIEAVAPWVLAIVVLFLFALWSGYFLYFEAARNGQTPGKKAVGIRVIRDTGHPVDFRAAVLRNVMRFVDMLPGVYAVGFISVFASSQYRRLGDYVAGTLVVKTLTAPRPAPAGQHGQETGRIGAAVAEPAAAPASGGAAPPPVRPTQPLVAPRLPQEALPYLHTIQRDDFRAVRHFLDRRRELDPAVARALAWKLAHPLAVRLNLDPAKIQDPIVFLEDVGTEWERRMVH